MIVNTWKYLSNYERQLCWQTKTAFKYFCCTYYMLLLLARRCEQKCPRNESKANVRVRLFAKGCPPLTSWLSGVLGSINKDPLESSLLTWPFWPATTTSQLSVHLFGPNMVKSHFSSWENEAFFWECSVDNYKELQRASEDDNASVDMAQMCLETFCLWWLLSGTRLKSLRH